MHIKCGETLCNMRTSCCFLKTPDSYFEAITGHSCGEYALFCDHLVDICRRAVRQRRNPKASADLTSVQELLAAIDRETHSGETL